MVQISKQKTTVGESVVSQNTKHTVVTTVSRVQQWNFVNCYHRSMTSQTNQDCLVTTSKLSATKLIVHLTCT